MLNKKYKNILKNFVIITIFF